MFVMGRENSVKPSFQIRLIGRVDFSKCSVFSSSAGLLVQPIDVDAFEVRVFERFKRRLDCRLSCRIRPFANKAFQPFLRSLG